MIDLSYYRDTFHGRDASDDELTRYISRAQDMVMAMLSPREYESFDALDQAKIDKAVAYQTEYLVENGDVFSEAGGESEKVGSWSMSGGGSRSRLLSPIVRDLLASYGLMNPFVEVRYETD